MSNDELQQLKALALCATAGPWGCFANEEDSGEVSHDVIAINSGVHIFSEDHLPSEETAQYIAAASPDVILALIAKVEAAPSSANGAEGLPELPPSLPIDWPNVNSVALGCGIEDRGIRDRYEAAEYGFEDGVQKAACCVPDVIYDADQMQAYARASVLAERAACAAIADSMGGNATTGDQVADYIRARK